MRRRFGLLLTASLLSAAPLFAQETVPGPGRLEVTIIPGGATFFVSKGAAPSFGNYTLGGTLTYNINRFVGVEGEVGGSLGITQDLAFGGITTNEKTPNMLNYSGNVVFSPSTGHSVTPYITGGIGGLTLYERPALGVTSTENLLTGNVGGGVKWYAPNGRWGLRGDYRFIGAASKDDAPAFFGQDNRYGHRVYGAVLINAIR